MSVSFSGAILGKQSVLAIVSIPDGTVRQKLMPL
jgi:hypothetical protein